MNGEAEPIPLPDHLKGRKLFKYGEDSRYIDGFKIVGRLGELDGVLDDLWPMLTTEQRQGVVMASIIMPYRTSPTMRWRELMINKHIEICTDGDIRVDLTDNQMVALKAREQATSGGKENGY